MNSRPPPGGADTGAAASTTRGGRIVLVTGDSSGLGRAAAARLAGLGDRVYGASRHAPERPFAWRHLTMDVTDPASVGAAVATIVAAEDRLDAVVHFAGVSFAGAVEETTAEEAARHFDVNYFGAVRLLAAVLPVMRRQSGGRIVVVGSIAGLIGLPYLAHYSAAKAALDRLVEALRPEVTPFGIEVAIVHPGDYRTDISAKGGRAAASGQTGCYGEACGRALAFYADKEVRGPLPDHLARRIEALLARRRLPPVAVVGLPLERLGVIGKRLLPSRLFEWLMSRLYGP